MKKLKWGLLTCLTVTSSIIPVLSTTACGKKTEEVNKVGAEYDKEYGVDQAVYAKMKNEFWNKVEIQMRREGATEFQIQQERTNLNDTFSEYDEQLATNPQLSYTALTNAMIDFAAQTYKIKLTRQTSKKTATWDDLTATFEGMVQSMNQYMIGSNVPEGQRQIILQKAREDFEGVDGLKARIREQYDDPLLGLIKAKGEMLSCFSEMNEDIGLVAASNRLKNFLEDYDIEYNKRPDESNKLDNLETNDWFKVGADLSVNSNITKIYKITRRVDGQEINPFNPETVCPGYTVKPFLKDIHKNPRMNSYSLDIDWTCVKTIYLKSNDPEKAEKTTAHYYRPDIDEMSKIDTTDAYNALKEASKESYLEYSVSLTKAGEKKAIEETYFNQESEDGYISFGWDTNPSGEKVNAFDALFDGIPLENKANGVEFEYFVDMDALAKSGLTISYQNKNHPERNDAPVRLDDLTAVNGTKSKDSEIIEQQDELVKDFLEYCVPWADATPHETQTTNSGKYSATNSVYVDYQNSEYDPLDNFDSSYCVLESASVNNYEISTNSYDYLTTAFNEQEDFVSEYTKNKYQSEYKSTKNDVIMETVFIALTLLFTVITTVHCAAPIFVAHLALYGVMLILAWLCLAAQITMMSLNIDKKLIPLEDFVDKIDEIKNSSEIKKYGDEINDSKETNHLCRYNEETRSIKKSDYDKKYHEFMDGADFFQDVLPAIEYYQNVNELDSFQQFYSTIQNNDVDPKNYQEVMEPWDKSGACTIAYWTLLGSTIVLDISVIVLTRTFCPEMSDWQLLKQAVVEARQNGTSTKSVVQTYQRLKKTKQFLKNLDKAIQAGTQSLDGLKGVSAKSIKAFLSSKGITEEALDWWPALSGEAGYNTAAEAGKKFTQYIKNFDMRAGKNIADSYKRATELTNNLQKMVEAGQGGFSGVMKTVIGLDKSQKISKAAGKCLSCIFSDFFSAIEGAEIVDQSLSQAFKNFKSLYDNLSTIAQRLVTQSVHAGKACIETGNVAEAMQFLQNIDSVMFNATYFQKEIITSGVQFSQKLTRGIESVYQSVRSVFDWFAEQAINGTFTLVADL